MVVHTCILCVFTTNYKQVYNNHLKSKKHRELHSEEENNIHYNVCKCCNKKYKSYSALWKHKKTCLPPVEDTKNTTISTELFQQMIESNAQLHNDIKELKEAHKNQGKTLSLPSTVTNTVTNNINNTNNTTNNNNIHIYLNTHCSNAMTIDQFVDSMKFVKDDYNEIDRNRFYYQGATNILKKYFNQLKLEDRPMHCATPTVNKPVAFFVRDENQWKEECQSMAHYQMKYIEEFENKEEQLAITRFFEKFNEKLYETYKELSSSDKQMERRINDKMMGGGSKDKIDMLDELAESKLLTIKHDQVVENHPNAL